MHAHKTTLLVQLRTCSLTSKRHRSYLDATRLAHLCERFLAERAEIHPLACAYAQARTHARTLTFASTNECVHAHR